MGLCGSTSSDSLLKQQKLRSRAIDCQLSVVPSHISQKLLLLGPGESGKSTCVKQMRILHAKGFSPIEREEKKYVVYSNTVRGMLDIVRGMPKVGVMFSDSTLMAEVNILERCVEQESEISSFSLPVKTAIKRLWRDEGVKKSFAGRCGVYQCQESIIYFFEHIDRITEKDYLPTNEDVLLTRTPTTGVVKINFKFNDIDFEVVDVGGQRSERRKWIHFFDDVNALIFVAAISEYDQTTREDNQTNRLIEALELFDSIVNSRYFRRSSMILFLNKIDLFAVKIHRTPLSVTFSGYKGGMNYDECIAYIRRQFTRLSRRPNQMYVHATCATDTKQLDNIFSSVLDTIIQENLKDTGIL